jgi:hypothetical protein
MHRDHEVESQERSWLIEGPVSGTRARCDGSGDSLSQQAQLERIGARLCPAQLAKHAGGAVQRMGAWARSVMAAC